MVMSFILFQVEKRILETLEKKKVLHYLEVANLLACSPTRAIQLLKQLALSNSKLEYRNGYLRLKDNLDEKTLTSNINIDQIKENLKEEFQEKITKLEQKIQELEKENNKLKQDLKIEVMRYVNSKIKPHLCESCQEVVVKILYSEEEIKEQES